MREGGRLKKRERKIERRGSETDVPKLYTYNEYEHSVSLRYVLKYTNFHRLIIIFLRFALSSLHDSGPLKDVSLGKYFTV